MKSYVATMQRQINFRTLNEIDVIRICISDLSCGISLPGYKDILSHDMLSQVFTKYYSPETSTGL